MERLPEDAVRKLMDLSHRLESLGARSIVNYVIYEFEVGGPSIDVLREAEEMVRRELEELQIVRNVIEELKSLIP